jgi:two-component system LytT family response regulator
VLTHLEELPQIVFSTAYDQYALQAFEVHAVDYLLKPYTQERFRLALERLSQRNNLEALRPLTESLLMEKQSFPERILVQAAKKLITIAVADILRVEAYGDYSKLITTQDTYLSNFGISALEGKLNPSIFLRIHRSTIINIHFIKEIEKYPNSYEVMMQNGDRVRVSRGYMEALRKLMF